MLHIARYKLAAASGLAALEFALVHREENFRVWKYLTAESIGAVDRILSLVANGIPVTWQRQCSFIHVRYPSPRSSSVLLEEPTPSDGPLLPAAPPLPLPMAVLTADRHVSKRAIDTAVMGMWNNTRAPAPRNSPLAPSALQISPMPCTMPRYWNCRPLPVAASAAALPEPAAAARPRWTYRRTLARSRGFVINEAMPPAAADAAKPPTKPTSSLLCFSPPLPSTD